MSEVADRRRAPRAEIVDTELSVQAFPIAVRLVDISLAGVLLESSYPVELGTRASLRLNFGGAPFSTVVTVQRVAPIRTSAGRESFSVGASFVGLSRHGQEIIERFADQ